MSSLTTSKASRMILFLQIIALALLSPATSARHLRNIEEEQTCTSSSTCSHGQYCKFEDEACNTQGSDTLTGLCTPLNFRCTRIFRPVCGCDYETYANSCLALSHGVSVMAFNRCEDEEEGET